MIRNFFLICVVLVLILAACSPAATPFPTMTDGPAPAESPVQSPLPTVSQPEGALLVYHRTGGLIGVNDTWTVAANGKVSYQGQLTNAPQRLDTAQVTELVAAVRAADFMSLQDSYIPENSCCDRFMHEITVSLAGQTKTVRTVDSSPTEPAGLTKLIQALNRLLVTSAQ